MITAYSIVLGGMPMYISYNPLPQAGVISQAQRNIALTASLMADVMSYPMAMDSCSMDRAMAIYTQEAASIN